MFPIRWNFPFRKKDGSMSTIGTEIEEAGESYTLPTASAEIKGGIKIGSGLSMTDEVLNTNNNFTPDYENERLIIGVHGDYNYFIPMNKEYIGEGDAGYEIETNPTSSSTAAKIDLYSIIYNDGEIVQKDFIKTLTHNGDKNYDDSNISITYISNDWTVTLKVPMYDESGNTYQSSLNWKYDVVVDYILLLEDPT